MTPDDLTALDQIRGAMAVHTCPDCAGTYRESPWAALRSLIVYRGDLYDEWRAAA